MCLARAAIVCKEIFSETDTSNGTFPQNCQRESIPQTLLVLVDMILEGSNPICHPPERGQLVMGKPYRGLPTTENDKSMSTQDVRAPHRLFFAECTQSLVTPQPRSSYSYKHSINPSCML